MRAPKSNRRSFDSLRSLRMTELWVGDGLRPITLADGFEVCGEVAEERGFVG
jgi:hypothetical protein